MCYRLPQVLGILSFFLHTFSFLSYSFFDAALSKRRFEVNKAAYFYNSVDSFSAAFEKVQFTSSTPTHFFMLLTIPDTSPSSRCCSSSSAFSTATRQLSCSSLTAATFSTITSS